MALIDEESNKRYMAQVRGLRTRAQNKLYWSYLTLIVSELRVDMTKEDLHMVFKHCFGMESTRKLNTEEFAEYIEFVVHKSIVCFDLDWELFDKK
jgi:galactose-1-phosphate uridylyltransferase